MKIENRLLELKAIKTITSVKTQKESSILFSELSLDSFYWDETREAYTRILTVLRKKGDLPTWEDLITDPKLSEETRSALRKYKKSGSKTPDSLANRLNEYKKCRKVHDFCKQGLEALREDSVDIEKVIKNLCTQATTLSSNSTRKDWMVNIGGDDDSAMTTAKKAMNPDLQHYVPTGFMAFDRHNQGIPFGSLVLIAGQTGGGKSILSGQIGKNAALGGYRTCIVPLEMTNVEMMQRELARESNTAMTTILNSKGMSKEKRAKILQDFEGFHKTLKKKKSLLSYFNPEEDMTVEDILYGLQPYDYDVIIIDYVGLLAGVNGDDQWNALRKVTRFCKLYAQHHNKIIILAAQLSEEGQLRYARGMKEDANLMFSWKITPEVKETGIIDVIVEKARNQSDRPFKLKIIWDKMKVVDVDDDDLEEDDDSGSKRKKKKSKKSIENYLDDKDEEF